jgi:hypothetical protein
VLLRWLATRTTLLIIDNAESDPTVASFARAILAEAEVRWAQGDSTKQDSSFLEHSSRHYWERIR